MNDQSVFEDIAAIVGTGNVQRDEDTRAFFAADLFFGGTPPVAVAAPATREELANVVRVITDSGLSVLPRGGGLSYTAGYVTGARDGVLVDTRRLNQVLDVNRDDMTLTVESGCTWEQAAEAAGAHGLRITMAGPTTGRYSTVGGSLSNNCMFFNSGKAGTAADSVLGIEVVLADGSVVQTGSDALKNSVPFFRNAGPDLTGLFLNDGGAMGVKASATLALEPIPDGVAFLSLAYDTFEDMIPAIQSIGRAGIASECLAVGPMTADGGPTLHAITEGWTQDIADAHAEAVTALAGSGATPQDPVVPKFMRDNGFGFVQSPLDAKGRLQSWTHGVFPLSRTLAAYQKLRDVIQAKADAMAEHGVDATMSFACAGRAMMVEPVLYWTGPPTALHLKGMAEQEGECGGESGPADKLVRTLRHEIRDAMDALGAAHMQYGRFYPYREALQEPAAALARGIKGIVDPSHRMNPGVLGL